MILMSIWERYFLREMAKSFFLFLGLFYALYVLIDYSNHSHSFHRFSFLELAYYYGFELIVRLNVLVPFAILISCVKTLCALNVHHELIALMASGIRLKRLLLPFLAFGLCFTTVIYLNSELLQPYAMRHHLQLDHQRAKEKKSRYRYPHIQQLTLADGSALISQRYDPLQKEFFDVFWIRSLDEVYRIRDLRLQPAGPAVGVVVEHLQRDASGALQLVERLESEGLSRAISGS